MYGVDGQGSCSDSHAGIVFHGFDIYCFPTTICMVHDMYTYIYCSPHGIAGCRHILESRRA